MNVRLRNLLIPGCLSLVISVHAEESTTTGEEEAAPGFVFPPEVEAILKETSDPDAYTKTERCISSRMIRNTQILDDRHVVFELTSNRYYLVQFKYRCPRLQPNAVLIYETRNDRLCRLDQVHAANSLLTRDIGPPCSIPGFMPVQPEQVALLKESLKAMRKAEVAAFREEKAKKKAAKQQRQEKEAADDG